MKILGIDSQFNISSNEIHQSIKQLFENGAPFQSPILQNYKTLTTAYNLPSKQLLKVEQSEYQKYIKILRRINKKMVNQAKEHILEDAKKVVRIIFVYL
jgi:hypothetical protein